MPDSQTTLYIVLAIAIALLTIFLCVALIYLILIFRDVQKMLDKTRQTVERVNAFIIKPMNLIGTVVDHVRPLLYAALEKRAGAFKKKKK